MRRETHEVERSLYSRTGTSEEHRGPRIFHNFRALVPLSRSLVSDSCSHEGLMGLTSSMVYPALGIKLSASRSAGLRQVISNIRFAM